MFTLFSGGGSGEVQRESEVSPAVWGIVRRKAINYLGLTGEKKSAVLLETLPFELWEGTNSFGDQFQLLYMNIGMAQYLQIKLDAESAENRNRFRRIAEAIQEVDNSTYLRFIVADIAEDDTEAVTTPTLATTSVVVERALSDFVTLVQNGGAVSGIDRVHTALHGYLLEICRQANITHNAGADITALFNLIRQQHPKFQARPPGTEPQKVFRGLAQIVDAMNPVRNHNSMAHPNSDLLEEPEAMLATNAVRSMLHYLNTKLQ